MVQRVKNLNDCLIPLTTLQAIFGYAVFQYPSGRPRLLFSVAYAILVTLVSWCLFILIIDHSLKSAWFKTEDKMIYTIVYANFVIAVLTQFCHWYYYKKYQDIVRRITKVDETLCTLGAIFDYQQNKKHGMIFIVFWLTMVTFENCIDSLWFWEKVPIGEIIIIVCTIHHPIHINTMVSIYYSLMIGQIGSRFCKANKLIEDLWKVNKGLVMDDKRLWLVGNKVSGISSEAPNIRAWKINDDPTRLLEIIRHIHLELTLTARDLETVYSVIILLESAAFFVMFTALFYVLYFMVVVVTPEKRLLRIIVVVAAAATYIPVFVFINHMCEKTTAEAERTGILISRIEREKQDANLNDEIKQFTLQLMTNRLSFSPGGFFTLGYDFLRGFFGSVVTYLVILIQMGSDTVSKWCSNCVDSVSRLRMKANSIKQLLLPTAICGWIIGIGIIEFPLGTRWPITSFIYTLSLIVGYGIVTKTTIGNGEPLVLRLNPTARQINRVFTFGTIFLYAFDTVIGWKRIRPVKNIVDRFERADRNVERIGISRNYRSIFFQQLMTIGAHYFLVSVVIVIWYKKLREDATTWEKTAGVLVVFNPVMIASFGDILYVTLLRFMAARFEQLNEFLNKMSTTTDDSPQHKRVLEYTLRSETRGGKRIFPTPATNDDSGAMRMARQYHHELTNIGLLMNDVFGIQVLVSMSVLFVFITGLLYRTSIILLWTSLSQKSIDKELVLTVCWLAFISYRIVVVISAAAKASDAISNFTLQLSQYSLTFTACGCFTLNYRLVQRIISSVTTYLIILVQIGDIPASNVFNNTTSNNIDPIDKKS